MTVAPGSPYDHRVKVLVVDDAALVRGRLVEMLREIAGVTAVFEADRIAGAVDVLHARAPEVVLLDLHLRDHSGMGFARLVRVERPGVLLIVMTSEPTAPAMRLCRKLGIDHFFDKSRDFEDVLRLVAEAVAPTRTLETSDG
jgi:DNA-binding NarL/FixJ family response regulator